MDAGDVGAEEVGECCDCRGMGMYMCMCVCACILNVNRRVG